MRDMIDQLESDKNPPLLSGSQDDEVKQLKKKMKDRLKAKQMEVVNLTSQLSELQD